MSNAFNEDKSKLPISDKSISNIAQFAAWNGQAPLEVAIYVTNTAVQITLQLPQSSFAFDSGTLGTIIEKYRPKKRIILPLFHYWNPGEVVGGIHILPSGQINYYLRTQPTKQVGISGVYLKGSWDV